ASAGADGRGVEGIHQGALAHTERDVYRRAVGRGGADPEVGLRRHAEAGEVAAAPLRGGHLAEPLVADRRERGTIEGLRELEVADDDAGVIDHETAPAPHAARLVARALRRTCNLQLVRCGRAPTAR